MAQQPNRTSSTTRRPNRILAPVQQFIRTEDAGGVVLLAAALVAGVWANIPGLGYFDLWHETVRVNIGTFDARLDLQHWVNDGVMTVFFFVVGLEIKRELVHGELAEPRKAALPVAAAIGGMAVPALFYAALNAGGDGARGWGIPMATDIAFALGVLALLGRRVPPQVRVFLLVLAVADDLGSILVIAAFYSGSIDLLPLAAAAATVGTIVAAERLGIRSLPVYLFLGLVLWATVFESGIQPTIAGVVLALLTPSRPYASGSRFIDYSPLERLERLLHPWSSFLVVPLVALANIGVDLSVRLFSDAASSSVSLGILVRPAGKLLGVLLATWLMTRLGLGRLPDGVTWPHVVGVGLLAGVGFTVSLFVTDLAFDRPDLIDQAKIGIVGASLIAGVAGYTFLRLASRPVLVASEEP